ncbi:MAG: zinc-binding dehydrogenase, partial [Myxococcales bacterium]|nr:zinc-binding dehydrogenase [Myxococcales bacterium]
PFVADAKGKRGAPQVNVIPTNLILMKGLKVLGCPTAIASHRDPEIRPPRLRRILDWVQAGAIHPVVAERYPLSEIATAMRAKWAPKTVGGIVVRPEVVRL